MSNSMGGEPTVSRRAEREEMTLTFVTKEDISPWIPVFARMMDGGRFGPSKAPTDVSGMGPELACRPHGGEDGRVNAICGVLSCGDVNAPLAAVSVGLHDYGTEGGEWTGEGVGLGFRSRPGAAGGQALRFDPEAGLACVADARLDDRETLCATLGVPQPERATLADGDLILRAFRGGGKRSRPTEVEPRDGDRIWLRCSDGTAEFVNMSPLVGRGVFAMW